MKSKYAVLATTLLFPLALISQHGSSGSAGGGASSANSSGSYSSSSSSGSHASSGGGSSASSGSSASRGSSSSSPAASRSSGAADSRSSAAQHSANGARNSSSGQSKTNLIQSKDNNAKSKPVPGNPSADKDHPKKSWLPWRRHSDKVAQKGNGEEKKPKCKDGKPCKEENTLAKVDDKKLKCIHGPCKVCPSGFSLNSKGVCVSAPQSTAYNCPPSSFNAGQTAGQPCGSSNFTQNSCGLLASELQQEEKALSMISSARRPVCAQDPESQECLDLTSRYELELERLQALQARYEACRRR